MCCGGVSVRMGRMEIMESSLRPSAKSVMSGVEVEVSAESTWQGKQVIQTGGALS